MAKQDLIKQDGIIEEALSNAMFRVRLQNDHQIVATISGKMRMHYIKILPGDKVAVVGLGGVGHMGVKLAVAMGADVYVITTSESKRDDAIRLGAKGVLISGVDPDWKMKGLDFVAKGVVMPNVSKDMQEHLCSFDFILDTVPVKHDLNPLLVMLKPDGVLSLVGEFMQMDEMLGINAIAGNRTISGSFIGGVAETQELLNFCGEHNIISDVEMIEMQDINTAFERTINKDVKYRFVIDMEKF